MQFYDWYRLQNQVCSYEVFAHNEFEYNPQEHSGKNELYYTRQQENNKCELILLEDWSFADILIGYANRDKALNETTNRKVWLIEW